MKTFTITPSNAKPASMSDGALGALALLGAIGTIACGIVAFSEAPAIEIADEIGAPSAAAGIRPVAIEPPSTFWGTLAAIGQSVLSYNAAIHSSCELGPARLTVDSGSAVSLSLGFLGRNIATIQVDASVRTCDPIPAPQDDHDVELAAASEESAAGSLVLVSDVRDVNVFGQANDMIESPRVEASFILKSDRFGRDGFSPAWPDSAEYAAPSGKRIYMDDMPITAPSVLVGEGGNAVTRSDA